MIMLHERFGAELAEALGAEEVTEHLEPHLNRATFFARYADGETKVARFDWCEVSQRGAMEKLVDQLSRPKPPEPEEEFDVDAERLALCL